MYQLGRPAKPRFSVIAGIVIIVTVAALMAATYWFIVRRDTGFETQNNPQALVTKIEADEDNFNVDEPFFSMTLPGKWSLGSRNPDAGYQSTQWNYVGEGSGGRWLRIYIDTIPKNFALNYLLPVESSGNSVDVGQMSENCVTFTKGATQNPERDVSTPIGSAVLPARWHGVDFWCDNSHVSHHVVGTGSTEAANTLTVSGSEQGKHRYFFVYRDDNFHPDYSIFITTLSTFRAK